MPFFFGNIHFASPWLLLLLLLLPVLLVYYLGKRRDYYAGVRLPLFPNLHELATWRSKLRPLLLPLRVLALLLLLTALARPQRLNVEEKISAQGIDIILAMDLSSSMLARDFDPDRLEVSKRVASTFVDKRQYDRIGLVAFAGESYTQCPVTFDHAVLKKDLAELQCGEALTDGTAIGMGLSTAVNRLKDSEAKSRVVILLTDGVNNAGYVRPIAAAEAARHQGIRIYTIGVGTVGAAMAPVRKLQNGGYAFDFMNVEIDEDLLITVANITGGKYFRATDAESLERIYADIDELEKTELDVRRMKRRADIFGPLIAWALALLALEWLLRHLVLRVLV